MLNYTITTATADEKKRIGQRITEYNHQKAPFTQTEPFIDLDFTLRTEDDRFIGGIRSCLYCWGILYVDILYVEEEFRGEGYGSVLLKKAEAEAQRQGGVLVHLDTFDWQGKEFYLKHGYEIFGVFDNCPQDHQRYYLKKGL